MKLETLAVHAGYSPDPTTRAVAVPIYQTTSYAFDDTQHGADLFDLKVPGNIYTRIMNPHQRRTGTARRGAGRRGRGAGGGLGDGGHHLRDSDRRRGRRQHRLGGQALRRHHNLLAHTLPRIGIQARFAAHDDVAALEALIDERTKAVFCETIGNPAGNIIDLQALADAAHRHGVPLIVDNTVATRCSAGRSSTAPTSSCTADQVHGRPRHQHRRDRGRLRQFDWAANKSRFPLLNTPDPSYHGVTYTEAFGPAAFIGRCRVVPLRNMGAALSPFNAFLILQGLETLALRMERHCDNALAVARYPQQHPQVAWVKYAGLADNPEHALARRRAARRRSCLRHPGRQRRRRALYRRLELVVRLSQHRRCQVPGLPPGEHHPPPVERRGTGPRWSSDDMVRLSIGIEHIDDILADLDQGSGRRRTLSGSVSPGERFVFAHSAG